MRLQQRIYINQSHFVLSFTRLLNSSNMMLKIRHLILSLSATALIVVGAWIITAMIRISRENGAIDRGQRNLSYIYMALHLYQESHGLLPTGTEPNNSLPPQKRLSWLTILASYWDYGGLGDWIARSEAWDSAHNFPISKLNYLTDSRDPQDLLPRGLTPYVGVAGLGVDSPTLPDHHPRRGVFGYDRATSLWDITDGLSTTMMVAETANANGPWTAGGPATARGLDQSRKPYVGKGKQFGGVKHRGALVLLADGSIRCFKERVDPTVFEATSTIAGGEEVALDPRTSLPVSSSSDRFKPH